MPLPMQPRGERDVEHPAPRTETSGVNSCPFLGFKGKRTEGPNGCLQMAVLWGAARGKPKGKQHVFGTARSARMANVDLDQYPPVKINEGACYLKGTCIRVLQCTAQLIRQVDFRCRFPDESARFFISSQMGGGKSNRVRISRYLVPWNVRIDSHRSLWTTDTIPEGPKVLGRATNFPVPHREPSQSCPGLTPPHSGGCLILEGQVQVFILFWWQTASFDLVWATPLDLSERGAVFCRIERGKFTQLPFAAHQKKGIFVSSG